MKKLGLMLILGLLLAGVLSMSCGGGGEVAEEITADPTPVVVDTEPEPPPPPPPPPPTLKESQFVTVYFDFDKFNLRSDAKADLDANYSLMMEFPSSTVKIEGHCDERGTVEYNLSLGEKRAKATRDYLIGLGIAPERIATISFGKERPANTSGNEAGWAKNRRSEFRVTAQ